MEATGPVLWGTPALQQRISRARLPILMARMRQCNSLAEMEDEVRDIIAPDPLSELAQIELARIVEIQPDAVLVRLTDDSVVALRFEEGFLLQRLKLLEDACQARQWDQLPLPRLEGQAGWILMPGATLWHDESIWIECADPIIDDRLQEKLKCWDHNASPKLNIERLFTIVEPCECDICCQILWEGEPVEFICQNQQCSRRLYHVACMQQWLMTDPTTQISFGRRFGKCPCCGERIELT
jgi:hypothetical protein